MIYFKHLPHLFYILVSFHFLAFSQPVNSHQNYGKDKLALSGYDVVEYHNLRAVKGEIAIESTYQGGKYRFSNLKNKLLFEKNPNKYLPQYGGWCAYAMGYSGEKVPINPKSFRIEKGKLYLFYKTRFTDTKKRWSKDHLKLKTKADKNWQQLILKTPSNEIKN